MPTIAIDSIVILENRQRREFEASALQELADSIEKGQQLQPIVLRRIGKDLVLVAGERRMRALRQIYELGGKAKFQGQWMPLGHIGYSEIGELSELEAEEAELEENLCRKDLTWQEHAEATRRIHMLRTAQKAAVGEVHTIKDTAVEVYGKSDGGRIDNTVRQEIILANNLDKPEVAKAKTATEALKVIKKLEEGERNKALAMEVGERFSANLHELYQADCIEWMRKYTGPKYDVMLTDPPYGINAQDFGDAAGKLSNIDHTYDDSYENWQQMMPEWCELAYKHAKDQAHAYVFCDIERFAELKQMMLNAGWYVFRTPFTVFKTDSGRVPLPSHGPRRQSEWLLYAIKGKKEVTCIMGDVIPCQADENMMFGAQKPVGLYINLLQRSVRPGDTVWDTFGGSGPVIPAAHALKCKAVYVERIPNQYALGVRRAAELKEASLLDLAGGQNA